MKLYNSTNKTIKMAGIVILCGLIFTSCKKFLDVQPESGFTPNLVIDNVPDAQQAVWGVYQELSGDYGYGVDLSLYFQVDNDEMMGPAGNGDGGKKDITHYTVSSSTVAAVLEYPFNQLYEGIERANNCIKYIPTMADFNNPANAANSAELHRLYGESLALRAFYYSNLVKIWGDVPAQWVPAGDLPSTFVPQTDRDTIYDHILNDLQIAENDVPWSWQTAPNGRLSQNAIRGLRARIALFAGGWSLRSNATMQRRSDWQTYYKIAKAECDTVIASGQNQLNLNFAGIFQNLCKGVNEYGEVLFQVGAIAGEATFGDSKVGLYDGPKPTTGTNALPNSSGSGGILVLPGYFYLFDSTDARRDVTCAPFTVGMTGGVSTGSVILAGTKLTAMYDGKDRRNWASNPISSLYLTEAWPILRYSDILLMDAEADNEINNGPSTNAQNYLAMVSARGHNNNPALVPVIPTDHLGFFNAIMKERSLEFGGEGLRKYDLIRWDSLASRIQETKNTLDSMYANSKGVGLGSGTYSYDGYTISQLPTSVYWKNDASGNVDWVTSFYFPNPSPTPSGATSASWFGSGLSTTFIPYFGSGFVPNQSELYPFHSTVLQADAGMITQNPGYH
jgi:hypothetical protein